MEHSRMANARGRIMYDHTLQHNKEIIDSCTSTYFPEHYEYNLIQDFLDMTVIPSSVVSVCEFQ
jgi:hypothetical protein